MTAHYLDTLDPQAQVDYVDTCQKRVAADTLAYEKTGTLTFEVGVREYALPDDLILLEGIFLGTERVCEATVHELLTVLSGPGEYLGELAYCTVGRTLHVIPTPTEELELTLIYAARPPDFDSDAELTLTGEAKDLMEELVDAQIAFDRGETEVGATGLARYETAAVHARGRVRHHGGRMGLR